MQKAGLGAAWLTIINDVPWAFNCVDVRLLPLEMHVHPFVFAEALSKLKYAIFSWERNCILNAPVASSGSLEETRLAAIYI